jgi:hypothetical protein
MFDVLVSHIYKKSIKSERLRAFTVARDKILEEVDTNLCMLG